MEIFAKVDVGNVRQVNQDYVLYEQNGDELLAIICDGMGGHNAGEVASLLSAQSILKHYRLQNALNSEEEIKLWMSNAIYHANKLLKQESEIDPALEGMGTTVVLALIKQQTIYISHVGDSRAYYYDGALHQLTRDDTLVNALVESGTISKDFAQYHPQKNILLQAVGVSDVLKISFYSQPMNEGMLFLCTDGLYNSLDDHQIIEILNEEGSLEDIGNHLINNANRFGGSDNIGIILIRNKGVNDDE